MATTFFLLAGEASGDNHAAKLITELKKLDASARFVGMGGPKMAAAGLEVAKDLEGMQVVGFWEVAKQYGFFKRVFHQLLDRLKQEHPSALICVDYPGFNLRFAREVRKLGIPVLYYIVPQVWAWKAMRAKSMAGFVDRAFCVFEFEPPFFEKFGLKTTFVGHPLVEDQQVHNDSAAMRRWLLPQGNSESSLPPPTRILGLFPGSRADELQHHLSPMCSAGWDIDTIAWVKFAPNLVGDWCHLGLFGSRAGAQHINLGFHRDLATSWPDVKAISELAEQARGLPPCDLRALALAADFSVVKSGTSTLEAGLAGNPMCVVYKSSFLSYAIAHLVVNIPVFSLVNIVLGRYAVPELLQGEVNPARIAQEIERGLTDEKYREQQKAALAELPKKLGGPGASARAAKGIMDFLKGKGE